MARGVPRHGHCSRGRREGAYPAVVVWAVAVCGCVCAPSASLGEGGNPPGACGVSEPALAGWRRMPRCVKPFPTPQVCCFLSV